MSIKQQAEILISRIKVLLEAQERGEPVKAELDAARKKLSLLCENGVQ